MPAYFSIPKGRGKGKVKVTQKREALQEMLMRSESNNFDVVIEFIQGLIPLGLREVAKQLQAEVAALAGERYVHGKERVRWGKQDGSVYLRDQKVPITVPRVRDKAGNSEVLLETYQRLQRPYLSDEQTVLKLLNGISTRKYRKSAELIPEVFGISPSNLSRRFKKSTAESLRRMMSRSLAQHDFVCIFIDGKRYAKDGLLVVLGVTIDGKKVILGIEQSHSENATAVKQLIERLIERGLRFEEGLLFIVDGSKGLIRAIEERFKEHAFIQRCQWHKEQNVLSYLDEAQQQICKRGLKEAYDQTTYQEAHAALEELHRELCRVNQSAANSLLEGLEETLTLHRLGLAPELKKSLNSTNCIESVMAQLGQYTDKVDRWHNSGQILRWTAAGLLEIEPRLNRIRGYRYLKLLRMKMLKEIEKCQKKIAPGCLRSDDLAAGIHIS
jgi:transposase-like protein